MVGNGSKFSKSIHFPNSATRALSTAVTYLTVLQTCTSTRVKSLTLGTAHAVLPLAPSLMSPRPRPNNPYTSTAGLMTFNVLLKISLTCLLISTCTSHWLLKRLLSVNGSKSQSRTCGKQQVNKPNTYTLSIFFSIAPMVTPWCWFLGHGF